jgi:hypothetical protein
MKYVVYALLEWFSLPTLECSWLTYFCNRNKLLSEGVIPTLIDVDVLLTRLAFSMS